MLFSIGEKKAPFPIPIFHFVTESFCYFGLLGAMASNFHLRGWATMTSGYSDVDIQKSTKRH